MLICNFSICYLAVMTKNEAWLLNEKYNGEKTEGFFTDCKRLALGEPLAYVIGSIPFLNTNIYLDSLPLIPRPETEFWTEKAINEIKKTPNPKVLDLCAGSGAIGVAVAKTAPETIVHFAELDKTHLPTIGKNLEANSISCTRYKVWQSDLFENVTETYDFILTNPPYIDPELDRTQASVKNYEPHVALYGGMDGMELIEKIIKEANAHLTPNGQLWIEHEPEQTTVITKIADAYNFSVSAHKDQFGIIRYSVLKKV